MIPRLHGLDHLRASAILGVVLYHYRAFYGLPTVWLDVVGRVGWSGVDLFFVLSGYLIASKLFDEVTTTGRIQFKAFYLARSLRILPAYWFVLAIYFLFPSWGEGIALQPLWRFLTFTQNFDFNPYRTSFSHAWSLSVEEHFYLVLPLLIWLFFAQKRWWLKERDRFGGAICFAIVLLLGIGLRWWAWQTDIQPKIGLENQLRAASIAIYYPSYARLDGLLVGVAIAALSKFRPGLTRAIQQWRDWLLLPAGLLLGSAYWLFGGSVTSANFATWPTLLFGFPILSIGFGFVVMAALSPYSVLYKTESKLTYWVAIFSYSIYLIHKIVNHLVATRLQLAEPWQLIVSLLLCGGVGSLIYFVIERPFIRLKSAILAQPPHPASPAKPPPA